MVWTGGITVLPGMELMGCPDLAVPAGVMQHVVRVESSFNPYAIGVVGGRLARQPDNLPEAVATARMLESRGYNFSLGLAQVNRHNLAKYGLASYEQAFQACPNLRAGSRILAECHERSGRDWGKSFSCYYSGNFVTGFRHGYVRKIYASMRQAPASAPRALAFPEAIDIVDSPRRTGPARRRAIATSSSRIGTAPMNPSTAAPVAADVADQPIPAASMDALQPETTAQDDGAIVLQPGGRAPPATTRHESAASTASVPDVALRDSAFVF